MSDDTKKTEDPARREALIKIGKYAAYTAPAMMMTVGTAQAGDAVPPDQTVVLPPSAPTSGPSPTP